jgi:serine/threonine protein kinase
MRECLICKHIYEDANERCPHDHSPLKTALPGHPLLANRYQIEERIANSSMGVVYRGSDLITGTPIAIKLISPEFTLADANTAELFFKAAEFIKVINHENIAQVYDYGKSPANTLFLIMEYIEGCSLQKLIEQDPEVGIERSVNLVSQICQGLIHLQQLGLPYSSIKPTEIIIYYDEVGNEKIKIIDAGFARIKTSQLCSALPCQLAQKLLDSPYYLAPEVCDGRRGDARSEVYALAAIFFHLLTGRPPFIGNSHAAIMGQHLSAPPPLPSQLRQGVPEAIDLLISHSLSKNVCDRVQSPSAFLMLLKMALLPAKPDSRPTTLSGNPLKAHLEEVNITPSAGAQFNNAARKRENTAALNAPSGQRSLSAPLQQRSNGESFQQQLISSEYLRKIEQMMLNSIRNNPILSQQDINIREFLRQLAEQFSARRVWQDDDYYVPHLVTIRVPRTTNERLETFELLFQSIYFTANLYNYLDEIGYKLMAKLKVEIEIADDIGAQQGVQLHIDWPNVQEIANGLDPVIQITPERIVANRPAIQISRVALLQSINAHAHNDQFLIIRPLTYLGRFRNVMNHNSGELVRRNDFAFLQSSEPNSANMSISRQHARIEFRDGNFFIYDLASLNGTIIQRRRGAGFQELRIGADDPVGERLCDKDIIQLGLAMISFELIDGMRINELIEQISCQADLLTPPGNTSDLYRTLGAVNLYEAGYY